MTFFLGFAGYRSAATSTNFEDACLVRSKKIYLWSLFARHFLYWIFPAVFVFLTLSFLIGVVWVRPYHSVLQNEPQAACFVFNNTRAHLDADNSTGWFVDYVVVGYNTSEVNESLKPVFEHYATVVECQGSQNDTCGYFHLPGNWFECLYNPKNFSQVISVSQAEMDLQTALQVFRLAPITNALFIVFLTFCAFGCARCCNKHLLEVVSGPTSRPRGSIVLQAAELLNYQPYRLALACVLEQEQGSDLQIKGAGRGGATPGGPIISTNDKQLQQEMADHSVVTTKDCIKIVGVSPIYEYCQPKQRWPIYLLMSLFLMFTALEWVVAFFLLKFWFFEMFALFGSMFAMGSWFTCFLLFRLLNDSDNGVEVVLEDGRSYRLIGGHFMNGIFGVTVSSSCRSSI